ncbi:structural maintenance of chromosomes protein 5 [Zerene cesonia]|uniref:structural maintenance of chromosomes protein 5 n=1 Tax=Zerene cesonia TaxID=33412 RepID=UPI0018E55342|nr:structural maintenance of chromosomes protein 5 [Zerene cesonia]
MSKVVNTNGNKPGSIYRIALENFLTYKEVELYPGPSLNVIIGPNGTGKSTFVCAIILGLCGKTSVIGRAKKISEYVRCGCEQASIEIELYQKPGQRNVIITRSFNLKELSMWYIDHKTVREKQVQELIASFNIQVDNLCQLLPQDRVQDFSKMNPQELLRSTLSAVGGQDSVAQLDELISTRNEQRCLNTTLENNAQMLQEQTRLNERLKVIIDTMNQRKEIEHEIEICEKKKLYIEYQDLREKVVEYTNDKKEAVKLVTSHKSKMEPLEKVLEKAKSGISKLEQQKLNAGRELHSLKDKVKETLNTVRSQEYTLKDLDSAFQETLERHQNKKRELLEAKTKLEKLVTDKERLVETVGDESRVKMELAELHKPITKTNAAIDTLKKQKLEVQYDLENNVTPQIRLYQNKIRNLEDVDLKRLEVLRSYSEDAYNAVMWLRDNKNMFEQPVYEPMMLEINFTDPKFARYLEASVAARDLVAFTFESSRDMNLFMKKVRELGLKRVNAVCSPPDSFTIQRQDISQLSYLGFYAYVSDALAAPAALRRWLCAHYRLHRVPVGDAHTYTHSARVPAHITHFFTENHKFSVRVSAYSGAKSSSTVEIRPARLLANTVDVEQITNFNNQLSRLEQTAQSHKTKIKEIETKLSALEVSLNEFNTKRKRINEGVEKVRTLSAQIRLQNKKIEDIQNEPTLNIEQEKEKCKRKQKEIVLQQCRAQEELSRIVKELQGKMLDRELWTIKLDISRNAIVQQDSQLRELRNELRNVQATLENIENLLTRAKSNAKEKLLEAKRSCNNKLPQDADFPYKQQFDELPSDLTRLQEHCFELQTRIECMDSGDEQIIKEYEARERAIAKLKMDVNSSADLNKRLEDKMNSLKAKWLPSLEILLSSINKGFGDMFAKMGCAGEIKLEKAGSDEDYDGYGVGVWVRFRAAEQLQQLTRHAQSGGERALSTALYLLALQARAAAVPFRCVDEINQGMDAINERKMFQLLVKVTTERDNSQYFLLTPKLLSKLEYDEKVTIHTIMNGKKIMNYRQWQYQKHLENARAYRQTS